jgi:hypothetical protein
MRKILVACMAALFVVASLVPMALAETDEVTGTFTASGTLSIEVDDTSPDFGTINPGANATKLLNVSNTGTATVDIQQNQTVKDSGDLTIGTAGALGSDEYSVEIMILAEYLDAGASDQVIAEDVAALGYQEYTLKVTLSSILTHEETNEQFSADVYASEST